MENSFLLSNSCENYILKNHSIIVAAYPSVIIFGESENGLKFKELKSLKFKSFECQLLIKTIEDIVAFFNLNEPSSKVSFFLDSTNEISYSWQGFVHKGRKSINLSLEHQKAVTFCVSLDLFDINNLVYLIKRCLLASLCLKDIEEKFILEVLHLTENQIRACKNNSGIAYTTVYCCITENNFSHIKKTSPYVELLMYYNDVIIVIQNLFNLWFDETNN